MKSILTALLVATLMTIGCKNPSERQQTVETPTLPTQTPQPVVSIEPDTLKPPIVGASTTTCYQLVEKNKNTYSCQITTRATANPYVSGYLDWSPYQKDGGHGKLTNMRDDRGMLVADFVYMIEGTVQTEEVYFILAGDKLTKMRTELVEKGNKLVAKEPKKLSPDVVLTKVDCAQMEGVIKNIKAIENKLK
jgi:hypothetical protein